MMMEFHYMRLLIWQSHATWGIPIYIFKNCCTSDLDISISISILIRLVYYSIHVHFVQISSISKTLYIYLWCWTRDSYNKGRPSLLFFFFKLNNNRKRDNKRENEEKETCSILNSKTSRLSDYCAEKWIESKQQKINTVETLKLVLTTLFYVPSLMMETVCTKRTWCEWVNKRIDTYND